MNKSGSSEQWIDRQQYRAGKSWRMKLLNETHNNKNGYTDYRDVVVNDNPYCLFL